MRISEFSKHSGLTIDTIRYYEKAGLIPTPLRDCGGRRIYSYDHIIWIEFHDLLKSTGMGIKDMARYVERHDLIQRHHTVIRNEIKRLQKIEIVLSDKITMFQAVLDGELNGDNLTYKKNNT